MKIRPIPIKRAFRSIADFLDKRSFIVFVLLAILLIISEFYFFSFKYNQISSITAQNVSEASIFNKKIFDVAVSEIQRETALFNKNSLESIANPFLPKKPVVSPSNASSTVK